MKTDTHLIKTIIKAHKKEITKELAKFWSVDIIINPNEKVERGGLFTKLKEAKEIINDAEMEQKQ